MFNIGKFLEKLSGDIQTSEQDKKQISIIVKKHTGLDVSYTLFDIKGFVVYIKTSPAIKNLIFINKKAILDDIASNTKHKITDIC
jgi:hypothetical protein